jgi:hypothetical protein
MTNVGNFTENTRSSNSHSLGSNTADRTSLTALFEEAIGSIQHSLSGADRTAFCYADPQSMLQELRAVCDANQKEHHRLLACSRKIALFSNKFAPYFDILNIFVQVKPEVLGSLWGLLRLIFKVVVAGLENTQYTNLPNRSAATMCFSWKRLQTCSKPSRIPFPSISSTWRNPDSNSKTTDMIG